MASPTVPAVEPSEREIDGKTGAKIRTSTDTRKANANKRTSGVTDFVRQGAAGPRHPGRDPPREEPRGAARWHAERHAGPSGRYVRGTRVLWPAPLLDHH